MVRAQFTVATVWFCCSVGCSSSDSTTIPPRKIDSSLKGMFEYYDERFDAKSKMLRLPFSSPGYHSKFETNSPVHPTRESLIYSLALLHRNDSNDIARAIDIIRTVLPLQDTDPRSKSYGTWPWLLEELLDQMSSPDLNWADFCGAQLVHILIQHGDKLSKGVRNEMRGSLRHAVNAIRRRNVKPGYTNIAVLGGGVCAAAGELFDESELLQYGRERLEGVVAYTEHHGSFGEYNSPPYIKVVIAECERTLDLVRDPATREAAESIRRSAWKIAAGSFHPATQQWAGPHSRTGRTRIHATTSDFLTQRIGTTIEPHPSRADDKPKGYEVIRPTSCPKDLLSRFTVSMTDLKEFKNVYRRDRAGNSLVTGTTWFSNDACLGSVTESTFWHQRKPLIAYWKTDQDPAVVFRVRFLHDGRDFASMGIRTVQKGPRTLSVFHSIPDSGDWHPSLDRPTTGVFHARDFRARFELSGKGVVAHAIGDGIFALRAGDFEAVVYAPPGRFVGREVEWKLGRDSDSAYVDAICYEGERKAFDFGRSVDFGLAAGIDLRSIERNELFELPEISRHNLGQVDVVWRFQDGESLMTSISD